jgi:hypothetical protein
MKLIVQFGNCSEEIRLGFLQSSDQMAVLVALN